MSVGRLCLRRTRVRRVGRSVVVHSRTTIGPVGAAVRRIAARRGRRPSLKLLNKNWKSLVNIEHANKHSYLVSSKFFFQSNTPASPSGIRWSHELELLPPWPFSSIPKPPPCRGFGAAPCRGFRAAAWLPPKKLSSKDCVRAVAEEKKLKLILTVD